MESINQGHSPYAVSFGAIGLGSSSTKPDAPAVKQEAEEDRGEWSAPNAG
jgi:hypothetical protein